MTVRHLLTMTAGLDWLEGDATYTAMYRSSDWVRFVLDLPMAAEPGKVFLYNSGASHVLSAIVNEAARPHGWNTLSFAQEFLFRLLGIAEQWNTGSQGIPIGGWGLQLTSREMASLGYLYLREGAWGGKRIVPAGWVSAATRLQAPAPSPGELGYGYQWWIYPLKGEYARYPAYAALGRYGQTIFVAPALDLVVVTTAQTSGHGPVFALIDEYIVPAIKTKK
jgi:CubicO group peptidase (beta-lactamase class C family)